MDDRLHPCAFFSRHLSPAEWNYDVGNRELLALVLQEWRHWLEGAPEPYIVWRDHKNLAFLRGAKQLNSRQAQWALFLGQFDFVLTYRPGSKNVKPDALLHQFSADPSNWDPELIPGLHHRSSNLACGGVRVRGAEGQCPTLADPRQIFRLFPRLHAPQRHRFRSCQFMSQVREAFCKPLRATASLCSGYHSQSNGQTEGKPGPGDHAEVRGSSDPCSVELLAALNGVRAQLPGPYRVWCLPICGVPGLPAAPLRLPGGGGCGSIGLGTPSSLPEVLANWYTPFFPFTSLQVQWGANRRRSPAPLYRPGQKIWLFVETCRSRWTRES